MRSATTLTSVAQQQTRTRRRKPIGCFHLACLDVEGGFHIFRLFLSLSPLFIFFSWLPRPLATPFTIASRSSGAASTSASPAPVQLGSAVTAVAEGTPDSAEPADVPDESDLPQPGAARPRRATGVFKAMMDAQQQRQEKDKGPTASDFPEVAVQFSPAVNLYLNKLLAELRKTEDLPSHFKRTGPLVFSQSERTAFNPPPPPPLPLYLLPFLSDLSPACVSLNPPDPSALIPEHETWGPRGLHASCCAGCRAALSWN